MSDRERAAIERASSGVGKMGTTWLRELGLAVASRDYPDAVRRWLRRVGIVD